MARDEDVREMKVEEELLAVLEEEAVVRADGPCVLLSPGHPST